jgi:broad specificity phosphatase PhoE
MPRLLLLRHAESEWNAEGRWQGVADPPLSPRGERHAAYAGPWLVPYRFSALATSDLRRARATAALIAPALGLTAPPAVDADLREYDVGQWSGLTRAEIGERWPGQIDAWRHGRLASTPGGERRVDFVARIHAAVLRLAAHPGGSVLVITHGGVIAALAQTLGAEPNRVAHLAGCWFTAGDGRLHLGEPVALPATDALPEGDDEGSPRGSSAVVDTGRR